MALVKLSKSWTLSGVLGMLRILAQALKNSKLTDDAIIDFFHLAVCEVAELLGEAGFNDYAAVDDLSVTNNQIDLATASGAVDKIKIIKDGDRVWDDDELAKLNTLAKIDQNSTAIYYDRHGDIIEVVSAVEVLPTTAKVYYSRLPEKTTTLTDYVDINDKYVKLAIDKAKVMIYESMDKQPPQGLSHSVESKVNAIRKATLDEMAVAKGQANA